MTDNEIIKAQALIKKLEEAYNAYYDTSKGMPYDIDTTLRETAICLENSLDEINRQKAEIERLNKEVDRLSQVVLYHDGQIADAKAEAIKEFAKRLQDDLGHLFIIHHPVVGELIDNLVKEMVGDME
jgi:archaellum component FlaC